MIEVLNDGCDKILLAAATKRTIVSFQNDNFEVDKQFIVVLFQNLCHMLFN